jgi:hypothetical protein
MKLERGSTFLWSIINFQQLDIARLRTCRGRLDPPLQNRPPPGGGLDEGALTCLEDLPISTRKAELMALAQSRGLPAAKPATLNS